MRYGYGFNLPGVTYIHLTKTRKKALSKAKRMARTFRRQTVALDFANKIKRTYDPRFL